MNATLRVMVTQQFVGLDRPPDAMAHQRQYDALKDSHS